MLMKSRPTQTIRELSSTNTSGEFCFTTHPKGFNSYAEGKQSDWNERMTGFKIKIFMIIPLIIVWFY